MHRFGWALNAESPTELSSRSEHEPWIIGAKNKFLLLNEEQTAAFHEEFHSDQELESKLLLWQNLPRTGPSVCWISEAVTEFSLTN